MLDLALDNSIYIDDPLAEAIQELDILLNTENTELIGDTQFGLSLDQFLWTLTPTTEAFKKYLQEKLYTLKYLNTFQYNVDVKYYTGEFRSIYHVIIEIYLNNQKKVKKEYEFR